MENMRKMLGTVGLSAVLLFIVGVAPAHAQATAGKFASPELVNTLTKDLKVTPEQATGGAGALFSLAKTRLKPAEFAKVSAAVPGMDDLLKAAPKPENSMMSSAAGALPGGASGLSSVASQFKALGLSPDMVSKFIPILTKFVSGKGGPDIGALLAGALK